MTDGVPHPSWARRWGAAIVAAMVVMVVAACAAALWYVDASGERLIADQEQQSLYSELDVFSEAFNEEGEAGLSRAVARRARLDTVGRIYALRTADGGLAEGNIVTWPADIGPNEEWRAVVTNRGPAHVATRTLASGAALLVGRDDAALRDFQANVLKAVWIAVAIVATACVGAATAVTSFMLRRVRRLSAVAQRVSGGDFTARAQDADEGGPFGDIARALNAMLDRIETLIVGLRTVTDSLAHDLRTPLARTRRVLEEGLSDGAVDAKQHALEAALTQTDRTLAMFTSLVDIARANGGVSRESMEPVDLAQAVIDIEDLFEPLAEERGQAIDADVEAMVVTGHRPLLLQAISNLVHNAIKYGPEGDHITLRLRRIEGGAEVIVSDHGPGIPDERRADAVQRFKRIAGAGDLQDGLGLGLAIVDACARLHGGELLLEDNAPGLRARLVLHTGTST